MLGRELHGTGTSAYRTSSYKTCNSSHTTTNTPPTSDTPFTCLCSTSSSTLLTKKNVLTCGSTCTWSSNAPSCSSTYFICTTSSCYQFGSYTYGTTYIFTCCSLTFDLTCGYRLDHIEYTSNIRKKPWIKKIIGITTSWPSHGRLMIQVIVIFLILIFHKLHKHYKKYMGLSKEVGIFVKMIKNTFLYFWKIVKNKK